MYRLFQLLDSEQVARLTEIAGGATWIDGRATNPTNSGKNNQQIEPGAARDESGRLLVEALRGNLAFNEMALPVAVAPPLLSRYSTGMAYAIHGDNAFINLGPQTLRNDLACTIFLADPASYDGGALVIHNGDVKAAFRLPAGQAILYSATMLHEVEPVTRGERLAAFTFIQSRIADPAKRAIVSDLSAIARTERERLSPAAHASLLVIQQNLLRDWGDAP
ncbi:MAG TPA: Fe2+-dependent dioxygenase [Sphingomicrobium sp.]|nr:Fe2+-dependent dioxygenase [Sphingomicrobium sp.]